MFQPNAKGLAQRGQGIAHSYKGSRPWIATVLVVVGAFFILAGCEKAAAKEDTTPPKLDITFNEQTPQGGKGAQVTVQPGGQITVARNWLGTAGGFDKADMDVNARDDEGVRHLEVSGSARGTCSTMGDSGQVTEVRGLSASFPMQTNTASSGAVKYPMYIQLSKDLLTDRSCGVRQVGDHREEFFFWIGQWTITARAENCCGGQTTSQFTINVR
jgi:hypothetical protein